MSDKIELRLSNVDPPSVEPRRTIYRDIANLPDPVKLGLTIRYFNHDDVGLYFQITGSASGYTFGTVNLGLLASGANAYANLDEFASRAKPSASDLTDGEMEENITLILKAYTDSGYTNLKWTYERIVTVYWINSLDAAWTVDMLNNFDDGTTQGWTGDGSTDKPFGVQTDYVLSAPYSIGGGTPWVTSSPNASKLVIYRDDVVLIYLEGTAPLAQGKWLRFVAPLPSNVTLTLKVRTFSPVINEWMTCFQKSIATPNKSKVFAIIDFRHWTDANYRYNRMDDFKLISK